MMRWLVTAAVVLLVACGNASDDAQDAPERATATPTLSSAPTAPQATTAPQTQIDFLMVEGGAPGERASVTIRTDPVGVECRIRYQTPNGTDSDAAGLEPGTTRGSGTYSWEWTIGASTEPGTGSVTVFCGDDSATSDIEIMP